MVDIKHKVRLVMIRTTIRTKDVFTWRKQQLDYAKLK